ncbi:MAG: hypothetical protein AAFX57_01555 [Bacteroidota bacterium]
MTSNGLISQALALQASYLFLEGKSKDENLASWNRWELVKTGLYQSSVVILVLATEIGLKAILKLTVGQFKRIHDLKKLYDSMPEVHREGISKIFNSKIENSDCTLDSVLKKHRKLFTDFRYLEGSINITPSLPQLNSALDSMINYYNEIKKE